MSIILDTILKIQNDFKDSDDYLTKNQMIEMKNKSYNFLFGKLTIWNDPRRPKEFHEVIPKSLFGFKSGVFFTNEGIYFLYDGVTWKEIWRFKFKQRYTVFKGTKKMFSGSHHDNYYQDVEIKPTVLKNVDKWDFPLEFDNKKNECIPGIEVYPNGLKLFMEGGFTKFINLKPDEIRFFKTLQSILKKESDDKEYLRLEALEKSHNKILLELDKDGNGEVDIIEGDDFNLLLKKHQNKIVEIDRNYVKQFVKVSSYLKTKKENIQSIFSSIKDTPNQKVLNEYVEILKDQIHTYNLVLINSLNMIVSFIEDDMITFYEIHEKFDTLNMFDSKHEKDVSLRLTNIGDGLKDLMYEIRNMGNKITNAIQELSYVTKESTNMLNNRLGEINSSLDTNNLLTMIQTYQTYKINKNTKSLRG